MFVLMCSCYQRQEDMYKTHGDNLMPVDHQWFETKLVAGVELTKSDNDRVARIRMEEEEAEFNRNLDMITRDFAELNFGVPLLIRG